MADNLRDLLDEEDDEINTDSVRSIAAWVTDGVPLLQRLAEALDGLAYSCDEGDVDGIDGALDAARRALDDVESHGLMLD